MKEAKDCDATGSKVTQEISDWQKGRISSKEKFNSIWSDFPKYLKPKYEEVKYVSLSDI